jgi:hypothetical protein
MALVLTFNIALQVLAAFVIFVIGYLAFLALLLISLFIATGIYECAKWIRAYAERSASANSSIPADVETPPHREKSFGIPAWRQRLVEMLAGDR